MISDIRYWEKKASEGHYAIPHFNVWNAEMLMGVIDAAEELRAPIIISFGTGFTGNTSFEDYCYMMESMAKKASVPVILHWDHGRNMTILQNAVDHCMNSVMRDASALPYEQNVAEIKRCVDYFHAYNIPVEAELGHVGNETIYEEALSEYRYTDPKQAKDFVDRTGCDSLAVAIGNVHGVYSSEPKLHLIFWKRLQMQLTFRLYFTEHQVSEMKILRKRSLLESLRSIYIQNYARLLWKRSTNIKTSRSWLWNVR